MFELQVNLLLNILDTNAMIALILSCFLSLVYRKNPLDESIITAENFEINKK